MHLFPELTGAEPTGAEPDADGHREPDWEAVRDALRELSPEELRDALTGGPMRPPHEPAHLEALPPRSASSATPAMMTAPR
ncbi:MAG TPA: hypothetical protein VNB94_11300 [Mycobacteriales bacterium]|nr:hypothetical protein [Mycobacteriales bacterium]